MSGMNVTLNLLSPHDHGVENKGLDQQRLMSDKGTNSRRLPIKILHIIQGRHFGGAEQVVLTLVKCFNPAHLKKATRINNSIEQLRDWDEFESENKLLVKEYQSIKEKVKKKYMDWHRKI